MLGDLPRYPQVCGGVGASPIPMPWRRRALDPLRGCHHTGPALGAPAERLALSGTYTGMPALARRALGGAHGLVTVGGPTMAVITSTVTHVPALAGRPLALGGATDASLTWPNRAVVAAVGGQDVVVEV